MVDSRSSLTSTPCLRMIPALASTSPCVWLGSGLRLSVQLTNVALRPEKSWESVTLATLAPRSDERGPDVTD